MDQDKTKGEGTSRRSFLKAATLTAGAVVVGGGAVPEKAEAGAIKAGGKVKMAGGIPVPVADAKNMVAGEYPKAVQISTGNVRGANDRIYVAFVGTGGMGGTHVRNYANDYQKRNIQIVGICDVYQRRREGNANFAREKGAASDKLVVDKDYRKILELKDLDAVTVATPEHWHGQVGVHAMEAGKHVYIQKPMTRYLDEAFQVHDTAVRTKRVVQVGSQGCTNMVYHTAGKAIREGKLGPLVMGQGSYTRNSANGEWNYSIDGDSTDKDLDWDIWLGSAPTHAWDGKMEGAGDGEQRDRRDSKAFFHRFRKYSDYSCGILSDLMPHKLHPFLIASGNPEYPVRVSCVGTQLDNDRDVCDTVQVVAEFPSKWTMLFVGSTVNEQGIQDVIRGHKATIYFGNTVDLKPERWASEQVDAATLPVDGPTFESHENHEKNWLDAIRGVVPKPNCDVELATKVQTIVSLAEMSLRMKKTMLFDEKTRKITTG